MIPAPEMKCPKCGSGDTLAFSDGSGRCRTCGNAFRGAGHLEASSAAAAGLGAATPEKASATPRRLRSPKLLVGVLGSFGGLLLVLAIPIGITAVAGLVGLRAEAVLAPIFQGYQAVAFCFLAMALFGVGFWGLIVGYQHAAGDIPLGGTLLTVAICGLVICALLILLRMLFVTAVGGVGGVLLLLAWYLDRRLV